MCRARVFWSPSNPNKTTTTKQNKQRAASLSMASTRRRKWKRKRPCRNRHNCISHWYGGQSAPWGNRTDSRLGFNGLVFHRLSDLCLPEGFHRRFPHPPPFPVLRGVGPGLWTATAIYSNQKPEVFLVDRDNCSSLSSKDEVGEGLQGSWCLALTRYRWRCDTREYEGLQKKRTESSHLRWKLGSQS